ncbi:MAG: 5-(carboxyamino)imidazole ribonucleotide mutase [Fibrobacterota bacterium]
MSDNTAVAIVMGSKSDQKVADKCAAVLEDYGIKYETKIISAHRTPKKCAAFSEEAESRGIKVIIAIAGLAAALPGTVAAHSLLPVIGVPAPSGALNGVDSLYSIVQMPPGIPTACVGIGNGANAAHLAALIIGRTDSSVRKKVAEFRKSFNDS